MRMRMWMWRCPVPWPPGNLQLARRLPPGNFQNLSDHHFQFLPQRRGQELIFPSPSFWTNAHIYTSLPDCVCACVCVCVEGTFEMRLKTANSWLRAAGSWLRVMNAVSAQVKF